MNQDDETARYRRYERQRAMARARQIVFNRRLSQRRDEEKNETLTFPDYGERTWGCWTEYEGMRYECGLMISQIIFKNNTVFPEGITVSEAIMLILLEDKDGGKEGALRFKPTNDDYQAWQNYYRYLRWCKVLYHGWA